MRAKQRRLRWPAGFWNIAGPVFIVLAMTHQGSLPPPSYIGSDNERAGFGVTTQISDFDVSLLNGGWFVRWDVQPAPAEPAGYIYMPMLRVTGSTFIPSGVELAAGVANNLGRTWIIGNEADNIWQDNVLPQDYAVAYHDAYFFIKQRDPTAQIAINGVTQGTPLRLQWLDLVWNSASPALYVASFRQADGVVVRSKGRQRWHIYCLTLDPAARVLFERRLRVAKEKVALIVASEIFATQPQLPRDFYGGDAFQQACIDAQDQQFDHILVLSPEHGVISLDDVVPSEQLWEDVLERRIWTWQNAAHNRLGRYLFAPPKMALPRADEVNWWAWLNPESRYTFTVFGSGFAVRILIDHLLRARGRAPHIWPEIVLAEPRPGYDVGDYDDEFELDFDLDEDLEDEDDFEAALRDIDRLLEWAGEFVTVIGAIGAPIVAAARILAPAAAPASAPAARYARQRRGSGSERARTTASTPDIPHSAAPRSTPAHVALMTTGAVVPRIAALHAAARGPASRRASAETALRVHSPAHQCTAWAAQVPGRSSG